MKPNFSIVFTKSRFKHLLILCLFLSTQIKDLHAQDNIRQKLELKYKSIPQDTLIRFIDNYGKDSLIKLLDKKIKQSVRFLQDKTVYLRNISNKAQLELLNKQFQLGLDSVTFVGLTRTDIGLNLYDQYFNDEDSLPAVVGISKSTMNVDSLVNAYIYDLSPRTFIITYCNILKASPKLIIDILLKDNNQMYDQVNNYFLLTQFIRNGCGADDAYNQQAKDSLFKVLNSIIYLKEDMPIEMDYDNIVDINRATAYGLYGKNVSLLDGKPLVYILDTQKTDGAWPQYDGERYSSDPLATLFGVWTLLEIKQHCIAY